MNKEHFLNFEGNKFFSRNINNLNNKNDLILEKLKTYKLSKMNILEIGCSNGWRLNELSKNSSENNYYGIDPSQDAINFGNLNYKNINFEIGTCDYMKYEDNKFDIILIPFVFMYIDRNSLLKSVSEIDRILKNNGKLIITDFYCNRHKKNIYKHVENSYIFKQNYFEIFLGSKNYFLEKLETFSHNTSLDTNIYDDTCFYAELKKDLFNLFD
jgi:ubiquinone/menaquinone biosynthesis C-methylase UbiE